MKNVICLTKKINLISIATFTLVLSLFSGAFCADRLVVKNAAANPSFKVEDTGCTTIAYSDSVASNVKYVMELSNNNPNLSYRSDVGFTLTDARDSITWVFRTSKSATEFGFTKDGTGDVEMRVINATNAAENVSIVMANGATCDSTGHWNDASSREYKENIEDLSAQEALDTLRNLAPVKYNYKRDPGKTVTPGFIAEDVPELVATSDRKTINAVEIVAILTRVIQTQQTTVTELSKKIDQLEQQLKIVNAQLNPLGNMEKEAHRKTTDLSQKF